MAMGRLVSSNLKSKGRWDGWNKRLLTFEEPQLEFNHNQILDDPKDGLLLFGPREQPMSTQYGVIGTSEGVKKFEAWINKLQGPIAAEESVPSSVMFPGFETVFRTSLSPNPRVRLLVSAEELSRSIRNTDSHQRVFDTVSLFYEPIRKWILEEDPRVAFWFVIVPEDVWLLCRPRSRILSAEGIEPEVPLRHSRALEIINHPDLFEDANIAAHKHQFENHFHNQLKAKLLDCKAVTQIVRDTTLAPLDFVDNGGNPIRKLQDDATIAWNISTSMFYKCGGKPWTLAEIRKGVTYVGLVFKQTNNPLADREACCGAQMFLQSGEGIVFKGSVGPWASDRPGEYHLGRDSAAEVIDQCVKTFAEWQGSTPNEVFIHGQTRFNQHEIEGFRSAVPAGTAITGVQIRRPNDLKLFRADGRGTVLRGLALQIDRKNAYLWTSGYIPRLLTYPGREVPSPLKVRVVFGSTGLSQVLEDIMALTKLNFNSCIYADGFPVTLRFAGDVGEILTAVPDPASTPLPFRHYI